MAKAGRPKTPKEQIKSPGLSVRLSAEERAIIKAAIQESGLTQSEWLRKCLIYVAMNGIRII